jgi:hypothetical protein
MWNLVFCPKGKHRLQVFENRVLRKIFGPKRVEITGGQGNCIVGHLIIYTVHQVLG